MQVMCPKCTAKDYLVKLLMRNEETRRRERESRCEVLRAADRYA
jgi:hypothetical protein